MSIMLCLSSFMKFCRFRYMDKAAKRFLSKAKTCYVVETCFSSDMAKIHYKIEQEIKTMDFLFDFLH